MDISNEQLLEAYDRVPRPIRAFIANSELPPIITELGTKHGLHVDTVGILGDLITKTLLGFVRPEVLPGMLTMQLHISEQTTSSLLSDINERVFVPLQKRVRDAAEEEQQEQELEKELRESAPPEPVPTAPTKPEPIPPPAIEYAPATPVVEPTLPGSPVKTPMPSVAPTSSPVAQPETIPPAMTPAPVQHVVHAAPTHQQGWHPAAAVHIFVPSQGNQHLGAQAPVLQPQPQIHVEESVPQQTIVPEAPKPMLPAQPAAPASKSVGSDPYREPI